jgi:hypothetical protein
MRVFDLSRTNQNVASNIRIGENNSFLQADNTFRSQDRKIVSTIYVEKNHIFICGYVPSRKNSNLNSIQIQYPEKGTSRVNMQIPLKGIIG